MHGGAFSGSDCSSAPADPVGLPEAQETEATKARGAPWADTYTAEYIALTQLQAEAFVTLDAGLAHDVRGLIKSAPFEVLS